MNKLSYLFIGVLLIAGCKDDSKQLQQEHELRMRDSLAMMRQTQQKDSAIVSYVKTLDDIQSNIDSIKSKERILSVTGEGGSTHNIISDIKSLDAKIIRENRRIYQLEKRLKKEDSKDVGLQNVIKHLTKELTEKDAQIADLQTKRAESDGSLKRVTEQFNDSITVIHKEREEVNAMRDVINTVYYALGTIKELKVNKVVNREGSVIGIGGATELKPDFNNAYFTKGDMTKLHDIPLYSKFVKLVTIHPSSSYKISGNSSSDTLHILDGTSFWSVSKYLVIQVK